MTDRAPESPLWIAEGRKPRILVFRGVPAVTAELTALIRRLLQPDVDWCRDVAHEQSVAEHGQADFAIVLGGDGSILRAAAKLGHAQIPILGVNVGKLGFLADISPGLVGLVLPRVLAGDFRVVRHLMFQCRIYRGAEIVKETLGLNEVAILGGPPYSILDIDLRIQGAWVTTYSCDGLLVSTPVGSTAHSLSAGGPILQKGLNAFVVCPLSPHTLTVRPLVDSADYAYEMQVQEPNAATAVVVDGQCIHSLQSGEYVRVTRADTQFQLIEVAGQSYYRTLREKLGWAGQIRRQEGMGPSGSQQG